MSGECDKCGEHCLDCICGKPKTHGWISVKDKLPNEAYRCYLVFSCCVGINICKWTQYSDGKWGWKLNQPFTHWMPLPLPPQINEDS